MAAKQEENRLVGKQITLEGPGWKMQAQVTVPTGPTRQSEMLPLARGLADAIVGETVKETAKQGKPISCKAGCGACCRQLVAISEVEARRLAQVVEAMPEPRRSEIRSRFSEGLRQFDAAGLLQRLQEMEQWTDAEYGEIAQNYFNQHVACPFLEAESCSIYAERPITCREYLVTSPAANCAQPTAENTVRVKLPLNVFNAVARWQVAPSTHFKERCVPLILALEFAAAHPDDPPAKPGVELLTELLDHLAEKNVPDA